MVTEEIGWTMRTDSKPIRWSTTMIPLCDSVHGIVQYIYTFCYEGVHETTSANILGSGVVVDACKVHPVFAIAPRFEIEAALTPIVAELPPSSFDVQ
eukprot:1212343-Amphidinium_carterae.1